MGKADRLKMMVEERCKNSHFYPFTVWGHSLDTAEKAKLLAERVGADPEICWLSGLLHDIGAIEQGADNHHKTGADIAGEMLMNLSYPENAIKAVQRCIFAHRGSQSVERETIEARVVASADAMSHFERVSELIETARGSFGKSPDEAIEWTRSKLERSWDKLMPEAKDMAQEAHDTALKALSV